MLEPNAATDLLWVLDRALERGEHLFLPEEHAVFARLRSMEPEVLVHWARLVRRVHPVQRETDAAPFTDTLVEADLLSHEVPWPIRAERSTVAELKAGARRLGLPTGGNRQTLVERMHALEDWSDERWVRVRHRALVRRADRLAHLERSPDPHKAVVERLGHVRWPAYAAEPAPPVFADRTELARWEEVAALLEIEEPPFPVDELLAALASGAGQSWGRLDLTRRIARTLLAAARELERAGETAEARHLYTEVQRHWPSSRVPATLRTAFTLEAEARPGDALEHLLELRSTVEGPDALSVQRTGRRLARACRRGWPPLRPLPPVRERSIELPNPGVHAGRPTFGGHFVERATILHLAEQGRHALHAEGGLWRHLYGLLLAPHAYFEPVGQLPVPFLSGPLDVGRPGFATRRKPVIEKTLQMLRDGRGPELLAESHERFAGTRLAGVSWQALDDDLQLLAGLGIPVVLHVLDILLKRGWRAARGLPDLVILPGPACRLEDARPSRLPDTLVLAELKTPNDTLSDDQRWWLARLEPLARTEVWKVRPVATPSRTP